MILQTICMAFYYNAGATFAALGTQTGFFFQSLLGVVDSLAYQFELRRVVLGLTAIINCASLPSLV